MFVGYLFLFYICYYYRFWSNLVTGSIWFNMIKYLYKFNLNTGLSNRVIRFNLILSCGSTNDPMVRPSTQWLSVSAESMIEPSFKTMVQCVKVKKVYECPFLTDNKTNTYLYFCTIRKLVSSIIMHFSLGVEPTPTGVRAFLTLLNCLCLPITLR